MDRRNSDCAQYRTSIYVPPMSGVANSEDLYSDHISEKPRHFCRGFSYLSDVADDQAAMTAAFRFLRQPKNPIAPRPLAKSGRAAGSGVGVRVPRPA